MSYTCEKCNYHTIRIENFNRHLMSLKHNKENNEQTLCGYCNKKFKHSQSMYRHIKYTCKKNKDEDLKELVRLMNLQLEQQRNQMIQKDREIEYHKQQNENHQKQIDKLMDKDKADNHNKFIDRLVNEDEMNYIKDSKSINIRQNIKGSKPYIRQFITNNLRKIIKISTSFVGLAKTEINLIIH